MPCPADDVDIRGAGTQYKYIIMKDECIIIDGCIFEVFGYIEYCGL